MYFGVLQEPTHFSRCDTGCFASDFRSNLLTLSNSLQGSVYLLAHILTGCIDFWFQCSFPAVITGLRDFLALRPLLSRGSLEVSGPRSTYALRSPTTNVPEFPTDSSPLRPLVPHEFFSLYGFLYPTAFLYPVVSLFLRLFNPTAFRSCGLGE